MFNIPADLGITILVGGFMKEEQKLKIDSKQLSSDFSADIACIDDRKKKFQSKVNAHF